MKMIIAILMTTIGLNVHAEDICSTNTENGERVTIGIEENNLFSITHFGHSRNTYYALYSSQCIQTRAGHSCQLKKVQDLSTWNDMPDNLELDYKFTSRYLYSAELIGLGSLNVYFEPEECTNVIL